MAVVAVFSAFGLLVTTRGKDKARFASHDELGQGGSLEGDESAAQAGQRELLEELGLSAAAIRPRPVAQWHDTNLNIHYHLLAGYSSKQPQLLDNQRGLRWLRLDARPATTLTSSTDPLGRLWVPSAQRVATELLKAKLAEPAAVRRFAPPPLP